jgi:hypothetical protein
VCRRLPSAACSAHSGSDDPGEAQPCPTARSVAPR